MTEPSDNELGSITVNAGDVRGLRALLRIANDTSCARATRDLARLGLAGYLSTILGEPPVIEDGGACEEPDSSGGELDGLGGGNPA
jgi:hypothetical protein